MRCQLFPSLLVALFVIRAESEPLVVLPSSFRWNATNEILITPLGFVNHLVDVNVHVIALDADKTVYRQNLQAKIPGSTIAVRFDVPGGKEGSSRYRVEVMVQNDDKFQADVAGRPDIRTIDVLTDKVVYRPNDIVHIRALPITERGTLYDGDIKFSLVNPDGFELMKKVKRIEKRFIATDIQLPEHLNFGEWRIFAKAVGDTSRNSFSTPFNVQDYVLPPFRVLVTVGETDQWDAQLVTVVAKYPHGAVVSGNILVRCAPQTPHSASPTPIYDTSQIIVESEFVNGHWSDRVNVSSCWESENKRSFSLSAEVREWGAGGRVEDRLDVDAQMPAFELVPLRPGFQTTASQPVLILARATDKHAHGGNVRLEIETTCISTDRETMRTPLTSEGEVGRVLSLSLDTKSTCRALRIQARRKMGSQYSRRVTLFMPSFDRSPAIALSWIRASLPPAATFVVGDKFRAFVPTDSSLKLNFLVVCNGESIAMAGRARDDGLISFEVRPHMERQCVLYVFSILDNVRTDMLLFFVERDCPYSVSVSKSTITPAETVEVSLGGAPNGLATLSVTDQRMFALVQTFASVPSVDCWDLSFFNRPELKDGQARLINFLNVQNLSASFEGLCQEAGVLMIQHLKHCPKIQHSPSHVSNECLRTMVLACDHTLPPTTSTVCDRNSDSCATVNMAGMLGGDVRSSFRMPQPEQMTIRMDGPQTGRRKIKPALKIREFFPEVWMFEDFLLGREGRKRVTLESPHSVTQWAVSSSLWASGDMGACSPKAVTVTSIKDLFLVAELPTHVYVNETITARVTVRAEHIDEERLYSVCLSGLERHVCGDLGADGQRGQPTYSRITVSPARKSATKTITFRFLSVGESEVIFKLKDEDSYPGKYHCDVGAVHDMVKMKVTIAKRAETEEHFKRIILNSEKPLNRLTRPPDEEFILLEGENNLPSREIIEYSELRSPTSPQQLLTSVRINLADTEPVYSVAIELSKFLSMDTFVEDSHRGVPSKVERDKRAVLGGDSFITDVIRSLSVALYQFKSLHWSPVPPSFKKMEFYERQVGSLMSELLTFSDCHGNASCGFALYRNPQHISDRSVFLSTVSTSLLCEANADQNIVCPALHYLLSVMEDPLTNINDPSLKRIDFATDDDRVWFVMSLLNQLSFDCSIYDCLRNDWAWIKLRRTFMDLPSWAPRDMRTVAALAFMAPRTTAHIQRIKLYTSIQEGTLPYWTAGKTADGSVLAKLRSRYNDLLGRRNVKSGDILVNSLGVLAFVGRGIEPAYPIVEFDSLLDWIHEQLGSDQIASTALETYFAHRAIYEYRRHKQDPARKGPQIVQVQCSACYTKEYNVSDSAMLFYLPTSVRNLTLTTAGHSKIRVGVRILSAKRQRPRRELGQNEFYPITISVVQRRASVGALRQEVCLRSGTAMIDTLEMTHGLFTGFTTTPNHFHILANTTSTGVRLASPVVLSSYAVHFVLTNLKPQVDLCYEIGLIEPQNRYQPDRLAPVAISARHPSFDVIGQSLITHLDRSKRANIDESIETVCWQGTCSCAEATCTVRCAQCSSINKSKLREELCAPHSFGAAVEVRSVRDELLHGARYKVIDISLEHWKHLHNNTVPKPDRMEVWLRSCNRRCLQPHPGDNYYFGGDSAGIVVDHSARSHYVLRDEDRWEKAVDECGHLFSHLFTLTSCA